jgi:profilin
VAQIKPEEMEAIQVGFKDPSKIQGEGLKLNGEKYTVLSVNEESIRAKKVSLPLRRTPPCSRSKLTIVTLQGKEGLVIVKTKLSLIIAHHPESVTTPNCVNVVESLAAYLVKANY